MTEENKRQKLTLTLNKVVRSTIENKKSGGEVFVEVKKKVVISDKKAEEVKKILERAQADEHKELEIKKTDEELRKKREELLLKQKEEEEEHRKKVQDVLKEKSVDAKNETNGAKDFKDSAKAKDKSKDEETDDEKDKKAKALSKKFDDDKRRKKLTIRDISFNEDDDLDSVVINEEDNEAKAKFNIYKKTKEKEKQKHSDDLKSGNARVAHDIILPDTISVKDLANRMAEKGSDVIKKLIELGMMVTINQIIDADTAELVASSMGHQVHRISETALEDDLRIKDENENLKPRPPVVTVMGHVDHGKTSLLDALRQTDVVSGEAGGITQHIGAYQIKLPTGQKITFLDTPGHEAFSEMRARGANATDIVILVVAANDSIMPQTIEAINHAKAAKVPMIVAINKIDLPDANPQKVKTDLLQHEVLIEDMGGEVLCVEISAKKKINLEKLADAILLQAEMLQLKADPNRMAECIVIESQIEKGKGSVATVLVQKGTLKIGDIFVSGKCWGRVKAMFDDKGNKIKEALPSDPVLVLGFSDMPSAGDDFIVVDNEDKARQVAEIRAQKVKEKELVKTKRTTIDEIFENIKSGEKATLSVIIKADVHGSAEAICGILQKINSDKANINIVHSAVGGINESDVMLAKASKAVIIGFNVRASAKAAELAKRETIDIRYYSIIYNVADEMKNLLAGMLSPIIKENFIGYGDVIEVFKVGNGVKAAGCKVTQGVIKRGCKVRIIRDDVVIHEGTLSQLKRFKDDVKEAKEGVECGLSFENYNDIAVKDRIECFEIEEIKASL